MDFGTVLSIVGFYLSLISLLGSLFFIHLGNWYKDINTTEQKWRRYKTLNSSDKHIEAYLEAFDEKNPQAWIGFLLLSSFMLVLGIFAEMLKRYLPQGEVISSYLYLPIYLFFILFLIASMVYLVRGYRKVNRLFSEIDQKLS
jgi:hypothetical protein